MKSLDEKTIVNMYKTGKSMNTIAKELHVVSETIRQVLLRNQITIRNYRGQDPYENMATHLRHNVDVSWLRQFDDINKLIRLNRMMVKRDRFDIDTETYIKIVEKFYYDKDFEDIYDTWVSAPLDRKYWLQPTFDHITPRCMGGPNTADNLRVLTWFENRAKVHIDDETWKTIIKNIDQYIRLGRSE